MKGKKFLAFSLTVAMLAGSALTVSAAGVSDVFNAGYYADKYGDLKAAYGTDEAALLKHFMTSGAKEGRVMSPILDVVAYRNAYADLNAAFGDDWDAYVDHYLTYGIKEKRTTGVLFDLADYAAKNADVKAAYGDDYVEIAKHYVNFGIKEGRPGGEIAKAAPAAPAASNSNNGGTTTTPAPEEKPATTVPAEHVHVKGTPLGKVDATCTTDGYQEWRCNEVLLENKYDANGNWIGTGPKLADDGSELHCDQIWRETLKAAHVKPESEDNMYIVHATCASDGEMAYTCTRCKKQIDEIIPKLQPDYGKVAVKSVASTSCRLEDRGYDEYQCVNCKGAVHANKKVMREPLGHSVSWYANVTKAATCTEEGIRNGYCTVCGTNLTEKIDKLAHDEVPVTAYANAYVKLPDGTLTAVQHDVWDVTYCKNCKEITVADRAATPTEACADNDGDGACDKCGLPMNRQPRNHEAKVYKVGDIFSGKTE